MTFLICSRELACAKNGANVYKIRLPHPDLSGAPVQRP